MGLTLVINKIKPQGIVNADTDNNGAISIFDVTAIVNKILG